MLLFAACILVIVAGLCVTAGLMVGYGWGYDHGHDSSRRAQAAIDRDRASAGFRVIERQP